MIAIAVAAAGGADTVNKQDRFADIGTVFTQGTDIIERPGSSSRDEQQLMFGRAPLPAVARAARPGRALAA